MSDEAPSLSAAGPFGRVEDRDHATTSAPASAPALGATPQDRVERQARKSAASSKRLECIDDILRALDLVIYAEIAALYYLDCSTTRFILRSFLQLFMLTPATLLVPQTDHQRPYIGTIIGTNLLCLILHLVYACPESGEANRGYLHGSLIIDFVGQKAPSTKFLLMLLDIVIMALQLVMLPAHIKRSKRDRPAASTTRSTTGYDAETHAEGSRPHDMDLEERGTLRRSSTQSGTRELSERDELLDSIDQTAPADGRESADPLDDLHSGQTVVASLYVLDTAREQFEAFQNRDTSSGSAQSLQAAFSAAVAGMPTARWTTINRG